MDFAKDEDSAVLVKSLALLAKMKDRLGAIDSSRFPTAQSKAAAQLIDHTLAKLSEPALQAPMSPPVLYNTLFRIQELIDVLERGATSQISWPVVQYCDSLWSGLFPGAEPKIFYSSLPAHNYLIFPFTDILSRHLTPVLSRALIADLCKDRTFYCLQLASTEDDNVPLYAIIGHEFGHALARFHAAELTALRNKRLAGFAGSAKTALEGIDSALAPRRFRRLVTSVERLSEELFCDLVGVFLMGPAFYMSLYEMSWGNAKDQWSFAIEGARVVGYPSFHYRLSVLRQYGNIDQFSLEATKGFANLGDKDFKLVPDALKTVPCDHSKDVVGVFPDTDADSSVLTQLLASTLGTLKTSLADFIADAAGELSKWIPASQPISTHAVAELLRRFEHRVLPNIVPDGTLLGQPAEFREILTATAVCRLSLLVARKPDASAVRELDIVDRLTRKAMETSFIQREYLNWKPKQNP